MRDFLKRYRVFDCLAGLLVLVASASLADDETRARLVGLGARGFIQNAFDELEVLAAVRGLLGGER